MRRALLVIDMQRDSVEPGAPAAVEGAVELIPAINAAARDIRAEGGLVAWITRSYLPDGSNVEASRLPQWREHPFIVAGTPGAEQVPELEVEEVDLRLVKPRFSSFFGTDLDAALRAADVTELVLAGVDLSRCVRATAVEGISLDYDVSVPADCTSTRSPEAKAANLADLADLAVDVVPTLEPATSPSA